ncbi:MAG TPA: ribosomal protein S18-alanine N-acetyltransferase [bacterium]|nr:ribosomal protein S18-alanine N-acetyltransferase [bacterium]
MALRFEKTSDPLPVEIRAMRVGDIDEVFAIETASYTYPWPRQCFLDELMRNNYARYFVALAEGQIVGYAGFWLIAGESHITNIAVDYGFRRRKVAEQLLVFIIEQALANRCESMFLEVRRYNLPAQRLYTRYRFIPIRVREAYYRDNNEDAIELRVENTADPRFLSNFTEHRRSLNRLLYDEE